MQLSNAEVVARRDFTGGKANGLMHTIEIGLKAVRPSAPSVR